MFISVSFIVVMNFYLFSGDNDNEVGNVENAVIEEVCIDTEEIVCFIFARTSICPWYIHVSADLRV